MLLQKKTDRIKECPRYKKGVNSIASVHIVPFRKKPNL